MRFFLQFVEILLKPQNVYSEKKLRKKFRKEGFHPPLITDTTKNNVLKVSYFAHLLQHFSTDAEAGGTS